jgi:hypothetical protein
MTEEELHAWEKGFNNFGKHGLMVTKIQSLGLREC